MTEPNQISNEKPSDRNTKSRKASQIKRTKCWIEDALIQLIKTGRFEDISITELCAKAGVGRPTFYRHFSGKTDVLQSRIHRQFEDFLAEAEELSSNEVTIPQLTSLHCAIGRPIRALWSW